MRILATKSVRCVYSLLASCVYGVLSCVVSCDEWNFERNNFLIKIIAANIDPFFVPFNSMENS